MSEMGMVASAAERKRAIREVLARVADVAERAGLASTARDVRVTRLPKLEEERFSLVVLCWCARRLLHFSSRVSS